MGFVIHNFQAFNIRLCIFLLSVKGIQKLLKMLESVEPSYSMFIIKTFISFKPAGEVVAQ